MESRLHEEITLTKNSFIHCRLWNACIWVKSSEKLLLIFDVHNSTCKPLHIVKDPLILLHIRVPSQTEHSRSPFHCSVYPVLQTDYVYISDRSLKSNRAVAPSMYFKYSSNSINEVVFQFTIFTKLLKVHNLDLCCTSIESIQFQACTIIILWNIRLLFENLWWSCTSRLGLDLEMYLSCFSFPLYMHTDYPKA